MNKHHIPKIFFVIFSLLGLCILLNPEKSVLGSPLLITGEGATLIANQWAIVYGKADSNHISDILQTSDGGFLVVAWTEVDDTDNWDSWILKLDSNGAVVWQKSYGGSGQDTLDVAIETSSGNFIVAGTADLQGSGSLNAWVMNINPDGSIAWQKTYGGTGAEYVMSIDQTSDGGFVVGGTAEGGLWVLKLANNGDIQWQKIYGGSGGESGAIVRQTSDNGYIILGSTSSFGQTEYDIWVLRLNSDGSIVWQKTYAGDYEDYAYSIDEISSGGFILGGWVETELAGEEGWIAKLDANGNVDWENFYGSGEEFFDDGISSISETSDGGFVVTGRTSPPGAISEDAMIFKIDNSGVLIWQKAYGGGNADYGRVAKEISGGDYIFGVQTHSFGAGGADVFVLKLDSLGNAWACNLMVNLQLAVTDSNMVASNTSVVAQNGTAVATVSTFVPENVSTQTEILCPISLEQKCFLPVIRK